MNRKFSEADTRANFIDPMLSESGWSANEIIREHYFTAGTKEHWHEGKEKIPRKKFYEAIGWLEANNLVPDGRGKLTLKKKNAG